VQNPDAHLQHYFDHEEDARKSQASGPEMAVSAWNLGRPFLILPRPEGLGTIGRPAVAYGRAQWSRRRPRPNAPEPIYDS
jgi:hypothetical protein